jgi:hypothetical protein
MKIFENFSACGLGIYGTWLRVEFLIGFLFGNWRGVFCRQCWEIQ